MGAKVLYLHELSLIVNSSPDHLGEDEMLEFAQDLSFLITKHFGGEVVDVSHTDGNYPAVTLAYTDKIPRDGGVYQLVDQDVSIEEFLAPI